jgi:putative hydrolase of the HAD superfamily
VGGVALIEAVFFDAGETLLSPQPSWSELTTQILNERGYGVSVEQVREAWRHGGQHFLRAADEGRMFSTSQGESHAFWTTLYAEILSFLRIADEGAPQVLYETFSDPSTYALFADAVPTVEEFRSRGIKVGVISNFESWLKTLLDHLKIHDLFDVIAISGDLGWEKPDARIFEWAMREAGVGPKQSVHVGDSPNFDAQPAHDLGMVGVLLDRHGRWTDLDADYPTVTSLGELVGIVEGL